MHFSRMICRQMPCICIFLVKIVCLLSFFSISGFEGFTEGFIFDRRAPFHSGFHLKFNEYGKPDDMSLVLILLWNIQSNLFGPLSAPQKPISLQF